MALISCPGCSNQISSEAPACPQCGRTMRSEPPAPPNQPQPMAEQRQVVSSPVPVRVIVTDIDVSFGQLMWIMIKITFAAIPAAIIIAVIGGLVALVFGLLFGGLAAALAAARH